MVKRISSKTGAVRSFILKVNSDASFRAKFLRRPVEVLEKEGITLDENTKAETRRLAKLARTRIPDIGNIPVEFHKMLGVSDQKTSGAPRNPKEDPMALW